MLCKSSEKEGVRHGRTYKRKNMDVESACGLHPHWYFLCIDLYRPFCSTFRVFLVLAWQSASYNHFHDHIPVYNEPVQVLQPCELVFNEPDRYCLSCLCHRWMVDGPANWRSKNWFSGGFMGRFLLWPDQFCYLSREFSPVDAIFLDHWP